MARNSSRAEDDIIDLTELIETGDAAPGGKDSPPAASEAFEELLARTEAGDSNRAGASPPVVDPHEELDMLNMGDIDNLLESLDIPPQPRESAPKAQEAPSSAPSSGHDDLDSVLDDLLGPDEAGAPSSGQSAPSAPPASKGDSFTADLDAILGEEEPPAPAQGGGSEPMREAPRKPLPEPDADLDDILSSFEERPAAQPESKAAAKPAPPKASPEAVNSDAELDDLLSAFDEKPQAPKTPAAPAQAAKTPPPAPRAPAETPDIDADLDDILADVPPPSPPVVEKAPAAQPETDFDLPSDLDDLLDEPAAPPPSQIMEREAPINMDPQSREIMAAPVSAPPQELIAGICQNIIASQGSRVQESMTDFSRQLGSQSAHMEDLSRQTAELGKRLVACEAKLAAARARIAKLEKSVEAVATLEDLLKDGTSLHTGFTALIASAVSQALQGFNETRKPDPEVLESLDRLDARDRSSNARLDMIEKRLDEMEPNFNAQVEKAAAAAAARILHEEIGRLISGQ